MHFILKNNVLLSCVALFATLSLSSCGIDESDPALQRAKAAYAAADTEQVRANAPVALHEAKQALEQALKSKDQVALEQNAYLAERKAQMALETASRKQAEKEAMQLSKERDGLVLEAREREAQQALTQAQQERELAQQERQRAEEYRRQLEELQAKKTERGLVMNLEGDVLFATGKSDLMPGALHTMDKLASFLNQAPKKTILIEGHTDNRGTDEYNLHLSEQRAESVRGALITRGVDAGRISARGFGETRPIAANDNEAGRQQNRRVEIIIQDSE